MAALQAQVQELLAQNQRLQVRLAQDSHNSSKPPSSAPRERQLGLRRRSAKESDTLLRQVGETLHLVTAPNELVEHRSANMHVLSDAPGRDRATGYGLRRGLEGMPC